MAGYYIPLVATPQIGGGGGGGGGFTGGVLVVGLNIETGALDKTWQEIHDAAQNGVVCWLQPNGGVAYLTALVEGGESGKIVTPWSVDFIAFQESTAKSFSCIATSPNDFPVTIEG